LPKQCGGSLIECIDKHLKTQAQSGKNVDMMARLVQDFLLISLVPPLQQMPNFSIR
jgi:hypothetical protein